MALFVDLVALSNGLHGSVQMDSVALFSWIGWLRHYGIFTCEGVYIVEPIILYDYKLNSELVDEDTKEILTGILETTQRLNTYNCTKALLEQL